MLEERAARDYAAHFPETLRQRGISAEVLVERGHPASILLDLEAAREIGLVVMASHELSGLMRFALGSVADRVVRGGSVPCSWCAHSAMIGDRRGWNVRSYCSTDLSRASACYRRCASSPGVPCIRRRWCVAVPERPAGETAAAERHLEDVSARVQPGLEEHGCQLDTAVLHGQVAEQAL